MMIITKIRPLQILFLTGLTATAGCGGENTTEANGPKLAYILEKTATPTKWDPEGAEIVNFNHCVQRSEGQEQTIKATYQLHLDAIKFDLETIADAKANNYEVSSPPVKMHAASLVTACPSGAIATCDKGNVVEHYYTNADWILSEFEKSCGYSGSDTWSQPK